MITLPAGMVEDARNERHEHDAQVSDDGDYGWTWTCNCTATGACDDEDECLDDADRHEASAVLAAALSGCTIREEWRAKITDRFGEYVWSDWYVRREEADWWPAVWADLDDANAYVVERRLVIETEPAAIPQDGTG